MTAWSKVKHAERIGARPAVGLGERVRFLHDGRATTLRAAIMAHDGEAAPAAKTFLDLHRNSRYSC